MNSEAKIKAASAKEAAMELSVLDTKTKNRALLAMADAIIQQKEEILKANRKDIDSAEEKGVSKTLIDRLTLNEARINGMVKGLRTVAALKDPVGEIICKWKRPNGLKINKVRVSLGVIAIIYEARPNVTVDAAALCLKAGNCVILRGGSDAANSNMALAGIISKAAHASGIPQGAISLIETTDRKAIEELLTLRDYIDCVIPRGGAGLINMVIEKSRIPVIETGVGNCHAYVEESAGQKMAREIVFNAKVQRPSVCNAIETLLVDEKISREFLPKMLKRLKDAGVEIRGCEKTRAIDPSVKDATEEDWKTEYLDLIIAVKVVKSIDEAISHITKYGSHHSETIITNNKKKAVLFTSKLDSAALYVNASTRFTDGGEFGFGAEIGISTQKLHARGPMGLM
ncbi:MAG: glutamate-5-semialdehyde dehydrogenase [Candidatus Margulisiibacteriota bacterium]